MAHQLALFGHLLGAALLAAALAVEGVALAGLGRATTDTDVDAALRHGATAIRLYPVAWLLLFGCGAYMASTSTGWQGWVVVALVSTVAIPALGSAVAGPRLHLKAAALRSRLGRGTTDTTTEWDDVLVLTHRVRLGVAASVLWMMTLKPWVSGALSTLVSFLLLAWLSARWTRRNADATTAGGTAAT